MAITIKEIIVKTTINQAQHQTALSPEAIRKLKQEIIKEVIKIQEKKAEWEREW